MEWVVMEKVETDISSENGNGSFLVNLIKTSLSTEPTSNTMVQFIRYTFVGGFAFAVDIGSLFALTEFAGMHYLVSAAIAFLLGLTTNYALSVRWVFDRRSVDSKWKEFVIFTAIGLAGLGFNELFMWVFTGLAGIHYMGSKLLSTFFVYMWNFVVRKLTLFN